MSGSRALPAGRDAAIGWLRAHGYGSLVLEHVDYYRATSSLPDLVAGEAQPPFQRVGTAPAFEVAGGKAVSVYALPPAELHAPLAGVAWLCLAPAELPARGKSAPLAKGPVLSAGAAEDLAGEGVGFGVPLVFAGGRWYFAGSATTIDLSGPGSIHWRRLYDLDLVERDGAGGRFVAFDRVPPVARVAVDYTIDLPASNGRVEVAARLVSGTASQILLLNEESGAAFDDLAAATGTWRGAAIGSSRVLTGGWARLRSGSEKVEFAVLGEQLSGGREVDPALGLDWAGIEVAAPAGAGNVTYSVEVQRAR